MRWQKFGVYVVLLATWTAFAAWQYRGYLHERQLIRETLHQQAHSVMNALVGGIRSHRRLGRFFEAQLEGMLDELVKADDVLAVAVASEQGRIAAGRMELVDLPSPAEPGDHWDPAGFRLVEAFHLAPTETNADDEPPAGRAGRGRMGFGGPGRGLGRRQEGAPPGGPFARGGDFAAILVLERTRADLLTRNAARSHVFVAAGGGLVLLLIALAWRASARLISARGRTRVLETEARHLRELSQAAAGLAHETRNPLGLIRGWTQTLAEADVDAQQREQHARAVIEECDRVTARINQFLAFARPSEPAVASVDLAELLNELSTLLQPDLTATKVTLVTDVPESARHIRADRELLRQALFNLLQNAIEFSPQGEVVGVSAAVADNGDRWVEVADRGPGVKSEHVASLFTPYFTTRAGGTGLGLAIVRRIAAAHAWAVSYRERPGGGSVFVLEGIHA